MSLENATTEEITALVGSQGPSGSSNGNGNDDALATAAGAASQHGGSPSRPSSSSRRSRRRLHVVVIVLGDLGRSPRMQYHALSLLQEGHYVSLVGYTGEDLIPDLRRYASSGSSNRNANHQHHKASSTATPPTPPPRLTVIRFSVPKPPCSSWCCGGGAAAKLVYFAWRILSLAVCTWWALVWRVPHPHPHRHGHYDGDDDRAAPTRRRLRVDAVVVQNPPALPLLAVAWCFCWYERLRHRGGGGGGSPKKPALVIDWHNLGYSMLTGGAFQKVARLYERTVAPWADAHWTVTTAMKQYLLRDMNLNVAPPDDGNGSDDNSNNNNNLRRRGRRQRAAAIVQEVPDCPPEMFCVRSLTDQHDVLCKLGEKLEAACPRAWLTNFDRTTQTLLTEVVHKHSPRQQRSGGGGGGGGPVTRHRRGRPALVTSSTSWTPDEDFGILLQALLLLDDKIQAESSSLQVLVVVTGKGPEKTMYERKISQLGLRQVAITTLWLEPQDYPRLLAAADLGVSLHTSTSGLDLPMKVLDLFGCEVPVCAMKFACLDELVNDGVNGRVFTNPPELAALLWELLSPLTAEPEASNHGFGPLQHYSAALRHRSRWHENWLAKAWPVLEQVTTPSQSSTSSTLQEEP